MLQPSACPVLFSIRPAATSSRKQTKKCPRKSTSGFVERICRLDAQNENPGRTTQQSSSRRNNIAAILGGNFNDRVGLKRPERRTQRENADGQCRSLPVHAASVIGRLRMGWNLGMTRGAAQGRSRGGQLEHCRNRCGQQHNCNRLVHNSRNRKSGHR